MLVTFLFNAAFLGLCFWAFWPRYRFLSAEKDGNGYVLLIEQYRKFINRPKTLRFKGSGEHWFNTASGVPADSFMVGRLCNFVEFATVTSQFSKDIPSKDEEGCCGGGC